MRCVRVPAAVAAVALAAALLMAACTSSAQPRTAPPTHPSLPVSTPPATTSVAVPTPTPTLPTTSALPASSTAAPTTAPAPTSAAPTTPSAAPESTCTSVEVRVIRGSAAHGEEVAALQFVNSGAKRCTLVGYPRVTLLRNGQPIGVPSQPASAAPSSRTLAPGQIAESLLHDYTQTCEAPLSDSLRVRVPGSSQRAVRPGQMRACVLRTDKLGAPE